MRLEYYFYWFKATFKLSLALLSPRGGWGLRYFLVWQTRASCHISLPPIHMQKLPFSSLMRQSVPWSAAQCKHICETIKATAARRKHFTKLESRSASCAGETTAAVRSPPGTSQWFFFFLFIKLPLHELTICFAFYLNHKTHYWGMMYSSLETHFNFWNRDGKAKIKSPDL